MKQPQIDAVTINNGWVDAPDKGFLTHSEMMAKVHGIAEEEPMLGVRPRDSILHTIKETPAEVRVVDPQTGGEKGSKLARFDLLPPEALWKVAEVFGEGANKYADRNWERGYKWSLSVAALERHLNLWKRGENMDNGEGGIGVHHMAQVAWHALVLLTYELRGMGTDDRTPFIPGAGRE